MHLPSDIVHKLKQENNLKEEYFLGPHAFYSKNAHRIIQEKEGYRPPFTHDADRIIHSLSFARYFDKTQVFFWIQSDIHQKRMLHVQLVSKIARELAEVFKLNVHLVEAIALGHDIGHVPFGHDGETILSDLCENHGIGKYFHNYGSVWFLQNIELQNLTLPVLDGILCHNGEIHHGILAPQDLELTWDQFTKDTTKLLNGKNKDPLPKTLEGCLVRVVDTISYISRDVLDAEHLKLLSFKDIPQHVRNQLGNSNREIINTLINDLIKNSYNQPYISYSNDTYQALEDLYKFNLEKIYLHPDKMTPLPTIKKAFKLIWDYYYDDLIQNKKDSKIYQDHLYLNLNQIKIRYPKINSLENYPYYKESPEIIVRDFIAGMTDQYFWNLAKDIDPTLDFERIIIY